MVTKSGGSHLHGDVYDYLRNAALDANNYFNNLAGLPKPVSHRNQFGVAVGGPVYIPGIYKQTNKTFFFFNYEGHRDHNAGNTPAPYHCRVSKMGIFRHLLGAQIGTDALGRPIYTGQLYDPFSSRVLGTSYIRDPIPGNNLATYKGAHSSTALASSSSTITRPRSALRCQTTGAQRAFWRRTIPTSIAFESTTTLATVLGFMGGSRRSPTTRTKKLISSAQAILLVRGNEIPTTAGTLASA